MKNIINGEPEVAVELPSPDALREYETIVPGSAERIMNLLGDAARRNTIFVHRLELLKALAKSEGSLFESRIRAIVYCTSAFFVAAGIALELKEYSSSIWLVSLGVSHVMTIIIFSYMSLRTYRKVIKQVSEENGRIVLKSKTPSSGKDSL